MQGCRQVGNFHRFQVLEIEQLIFGFLVEGLVVLFMAKVIGWVVVDGLVRFEQACIQVDVPAVDDLMQFVDLYGSIVDS